ncbi:MAG: hypothetical protein LBB38_01915 [Puniceicoccales bacterium]|jgi:hypothetical protein|nr:hypothetical protein [Puniceicoccales bacterium]
MNLTKSSFPFGFDVLYAIKPPVKGQVISSMKAMGVTSAKGISPAMSQLLSATRPTDAIISAFTTPIIDSGIGECVANALLQLFRFYHGDAYLQLLICALTERPCSIHITPEGDSAAKIVAVRMNEVLRQRKWRNFAITRTICAPTCPSPLNRMLVAAITESYLRFGLDSTSWLWGTFLHVIMFNVYCAPICTILDADWSTFVGSISDDDNARFTAELVTNGEEIKRGELRLSHDVIVELIVADGCLSEDNVRMILAKCDEDMHRLYEFTKTPDGEPYVGYASEVESEGPSGSAVKVAAELLGDGSPSDANANTVIVFPDFFVELRRLASISLQALANDLSFVLGDVQSIVNCFHEKISKTQHFAFDLDLHDLVTKLFPDESNGQIFGLPTIETKFAFKLLESNGISPFGEFIPYMPKRPGPLFLAVGPVILDGNSHECMMAFYCDQEKKTLTVCWSDWTRTSDGIGPMFFIQTFPENEKVCVVACGNGTPLGVSLDFDKVRSLIDSEITCLRPFHSVAISQLAMS